MENIKTQKIWELSEPPPRGSSWKHMAESSQSFYTKQEISRNFHRYNPLGYPCSRIFQFSGAPPTKKCPNLKNRCPKCPIGALIGALNGALN